MIPTFNMLPFPILQLSLSSVLKCGQSFRWSAYSLPEDAFEYRFCLRDRVVCLRQTPENILYQTVLPDPQPDATQRKLREAETLLWLKDYFQLDIDLALLYDEWGSRDKVFSGIKDRFSGIRMLRQDPWENLISCVVRVLPISKANLESGSYAPQTTISPESPRWYRTCARNILLRFFLSLFQMDLVSNKHTTLFLLLRH